MIPLISSAWAEAPVAGPAAGPSPTANLVMLGVFVVIFYLLLWRPQSKRAKEHRDLVSGLSKGDEVVTNGGIAGRVTSVAEDFITVEIASNVEVTVQKSAVSATLPKGTLKAVNQSKGTTKSVQAS